MRHLALSIMVAVASVIPSGAATDSRPNIVFILADDLGFSDIGCYGGEIETPNLDRLAAEGLRFTQFYNCAKCETTRATVLSGRYHHEVGIGKLRNCVTFAEVLKDAGYTTLMSGKWHMTGNPVDRGFDHYFGHLSGACNYFRGDKTFRLDREVFKVPETGFYTTDADTDYAIQFIREADPGKPFVLYLAYNAPHYPLQAPKAEVLKYRGRYRIGWDKLREQRAARIKKMGLLGTDFEPAPRPADVPAWDSLDAEQKDVQELMMATFAGMVDRMDQNIGRLVATLKDLGRYENTLILFLSDNGACPFQRTTKKTLEQKLMPWDPESYYTYDKGWAHACNTPFREYKRNQHEGGIDTPFIAHWPAGIAQPGTTYHGRAHLVDLMATFIDVADTTYPSDRNGIQVGPARGETLVPIFKTGNRPPRGPIHFTFYGQHNALRDGDWKLVNINSGSWELYNIAEDRTELNNLASREPARLAKMVQQWQALAREIGVPQPKKKARK